MPMILYRCSKCGFEKNRFIRPKDVKSLAINEICPRTDCGGKYERILGTPKSTSKIIIDDGQPRALEVMPDIQEIMDQSADKGPDRGFGQGSGE
jgi:hypothetical protein